MHASINQINKVFIYLQLCKDWFRIRINHFKIVQWVSCIRIQHNVPLKVNTSLDEANLRFDFLLHRTTTKNNARFSHKRNEGFSKLHNILFHLISWVIVQLRLKYSSVQRRIWRLDLDYGICWNLIVKRIWLLLNLSVGQK
jgi:hypothetical protein